MLKEGKEEITGDQSIAQRMKLYFPSVFTQEKNDLPHFGNRGNDGLCNIYCTANEVEKHLKALNIHDKSPGLDMSHLAS